MNNTIIAAQGIEFAYDKLKILHGIDFESAKHRKTLIIGPNGAGKSTFLKVLGGILKQDKGEIFYNDTNISRYDSVRRVSKGIVYLKQNKVVFPGLTVEENLEIGGYCLSSNVLKEQKNRMFELFSELAAISSRRAELLSGGQRQMLGIAMVMMKSPELILLDEPTAGLAPSASRRIFDKIMYKLDENKMSVIIVEHNLAIVLDYVDTVRIMLQGKFIDKEYDSEEIQKNPHILDKHYFY